MEAKWRAIISGQNQRPAARLFRAALGMVTWPYGRVAAARNRLFDAGVLRTYRVGVPIVSIGNLTLGGTGKTPLVEFVCRWFLQRGKRPVILSRGYRRVTGVESSSPQPMVDNGSTNWGLEDSTPGTPARGHNDEALLLRANLPDVPHWQGKDRVALARQAIEQFHPDVLVLDDGFQHRRLARDLDIVLIDCTEPFGHGHLFPRGLLREPISELRRADLFVLSRAGQCTEAERVAIRGTLACYAGGKPTLLAEHRPVRWLSQGGKAVTVDSLVGLPVVAFCGIGNPEAFWQTLRGLGVRLVATRTFADHHGYGAADLRELDAWARQSQAAAVVTTQKDLVKIPAETLAGLPLWALQIEATIADSAGAFDRALRQLLAGKLKLADAA